MSYQEAVRWVRRSAAAVASPHLALILLDATVIAGALPAVYASDAQASCGARLLVRFAAHFILQSGLCVLAASLVALLFSGWVEGRKLGEATPGALGSGFLGAITLLFGMIAILFFLGAGIQLKVLGDPPALPASFEQTHACPALPETL